jgi:hypothetical protein
MVWIPGSLAKEQQRLTIGIAHAAAFCHIIQQICHCIHFSRHDISRQADYDEW